MFFAYNSRRSAEYVYYLPKNRWVDVPADRFRPCLSCRHRATKLTRRAPFTNFAVTTVYASRLINCVRIALAHKHTNRAIEPTRPCPFIYAKSSSHHRRAVPTVAISEEESYSRYLVDFRKSVHTINQSSWVTVEY